MEDWDPGESGPLNLILEKFQEGVGRGGVVGKAF